MEPERTTIRHIKPKAKTKGLTWLEYSFTAFNGSGYANRDGAYEFVESYILYKEWKKDYSAVGLAKEHYGRLITLSEYLIANSNGAGIEPSEKQARKFKTYLETTTRD